MRPLCLLALTATLLGASSASLNHLRWRLIGPFRGGRAVAVSGVPGDGATFYFGAVDGGIWKTTDAGTTWVPIFDGQPVASIGALAVAPSDPQVIYAGTGETDIRSNLASGDGVYKSTDGGRSWRNVGLKETRQISRIVVNPKDPKVVLVGALGHAYGPNTERGVYRSSDGGESWQKVLDRGPDVGVADLAISTDRPDVVFATLWEAHRPPWSTYAPIAGPGSGLFRSQDGGKSWLQLSGRGLPTTTWGRAGVAISPGTRAQRVYAVIDAAKEGGVFRSDDGGDSWIVVNKDARLTGRGWYFNSITADPNDPDVVYVPNVALYKLSEGGKSLSIVRGAPGGDDYHQLWIDPANSLRMVLGVDQGTTVSLNGGKTWSTWYNQPTAQFYHVIADNEFPYHVYGSQQDSGTGAVPTRSDRGQIDARDFFNVGGSESGYVALDAKDPDIFYVTGTFGTVDRYNRRTMQSQNIAPSPAPAGLAESINKRKMRDPWTPVLVRSAKAPYPLFLGTQFVMKTVDGGLHWQTISPDLTGAVPGRKDEGGTLSVEHARELGYGVVYSIAPSPLNVSEIWAGSDSGVVHFTQDGGKHWVNVTPPGLSAFSKITHIEASHFNAGEAYVAVDRHRLDDRKPYLFRTVDFGKTWTAIVEGMAEPAFLNCVREDPKHKGLLFAGTEFGVYASTDDGDHWMPLQLNLPMTSIRDIAIHGDDLIVATHGRSFWVLDDFSSLREFRAGSGMTETHLFTPARAVRIKSDSFLGTPLPPEEPQALNPPSGAILDYYLASAAAEISLDVLDAGGKTIRHYSSKEHSDPAGATAPIAARWFEKPRALESAAGSHRFVWDLRYGRSGLPDSGDDDDEDQRWLGPLVVPGRYDIKLTVDGREFRAPVQVTMDPRASASPAVLTAQFDWALKSFTDMIAARRAVAEMQGLQAKLERLQGNSVAVELRGKTEQLMSGETGMMMVSRSLTTALNTIENADRTPPSQVIALYEGAHQKIQPALAKWGQLKGSDLKRLNESLKRLGISEIQVSQLELQAEESLAK